MVLRLVPVGVTDPAAAAEAWHRIDSVRRLKTAPALRPIVIEQTTNALANGLPAFGFAEWAWAPAVVLDLAHVVASRRSFLANALRL